MLRTGGLYTEEVLVKRMMSVVEGMMKGSEAVNLSTAHSHTVKARSSKKQYNCLFILLSSYFV